MDFRTKIIYKLKLLFNWRTASFSAWKAVAANCAWWYRWVQCWVGVVFSISLCQFFLNLSLKLNQRNISVPYFVIWCISDKLVKKTWDTVSLIFRVYTLYWAQYCQFLRDCMHSKQNVYSLHLIALKMLNVRIKYLSCTKYI